MIRGSGELWLYSQRNSAGVEHDLDVLLAEPEVRLDSDELLTAHNFAVGLFNGYLDENLHANAFTARPNLEEIAQASIAANSQAYYLDYFKTEPGRGDLRRLLGTEKPEDITESLFGLVVSDERPEPTLRKTVANRSRDWYAGELARRLSDDPSQDSQQPDTDVVHVNFAPDKLLNKFENLQSYRKFYREVQRSINEAEPSDLHEAQQAILDVYRARVNNMAASLYPSLNNLARQLSHSPQTAETKQWDERLRKIASVAARVMWHDDEARRVALASNFTRRLDFVRNGADWSADRSISPLSSQLMILAEDLSRSPGHHTANAEQLPADMVNKLRGVRWNAEQLKSFCESVLEEWKLLSEHTTTWESADERSGFAEDKKWQVVVTPKVTALATSSRKKILSIPESFDRALTQESPAGALPVAAHEMTHVLQAQYDEVTAAAIPLARPQGRRSATGREMGAIMQERELHAMLGNDRPTNTTYLRALEAKLAGANQTQVARAFLEAKTSKNPSTLAVTAGKNILRLYRNGGYDTQSLDYIEQEVMLRALTSVLTEDQARAIAIAGSSFSLSDSAALHRAGLLDLPEQIPERPAQDVMQIFKEQFYPKIVS